MSLMSRSVRLCMAVSLALTSACGPQTDAGSPASASAVPVAEGVRTDLSPLLARFPELEGLTGAWWVSGELDAGRAPGPGSYWINAVVALPEARTSRWALELDLSLATVDPEVDEKLRGYVPDDEELLVGEALNGLMSHGSWTATAFLAVHDSKVVFVARGQ